MKAVSCDFERAPTLVASTLPALNSIRVGGCRVHQIWPGGFLVFVDVELGDLEFASVVLGDIVEDGAIILHGPHHSAQ